jgi:hypothetical protein
MKIMYKRALLALIAVAVGALISWLGGYNFDHCSEAVLITATIIFWFAFAVAIYPLDDDLK